MTTVDTAPFTGIANFRDFGGAPAPGGRVARGRLFRSAHHGEATSQDLEALQGLGLKVLVDLRRPTERAAQPSLRPEGFEAEVILNDLGDRAEAPHMEFLRRGEHDDASAHAFFNDYYRTAPFESRHLDLFARSLAALDATGGPILIHCAAGKDRTGVLAAVILAALGVEEEAITEDFLASNAHFATEARMAQVRDRLKELTGSDPSEAVLRGFVGVHPEYLRTVFQEIDRRAGGIDAYLASLGADDARRLSLRAKLVEQNTA